MWVDLKGSVRSAVNIESQTLTVKVNNKIFSYKSRRLPYAQKCFCTHQGLSYGSSDTFDIRQSPLTYVDGEFYQSRCLVDIPCLRDRKTLTGIPAFCYSKFLNRGISNLWCLIIW